MIPAVGKLVAAFLRELDAMIDRGVQEAASAAAGRLRGTGRKYSPRPATKRTIPTERARIPARARATTVAPAPEALPKFEGLTKEAESAVSPKSCDTASYTGRLSMTGPTRSHQVTRPGSPAPASRADRVGAGDRTYSKESTQQPKEHAAAPAAVGEPAPPADVLDRAIAVAIMGEQLADEAAAAPPRPAAPAPPPAVLREIAEQVIAAAAAGPEVTDEQLAEFDRTPMQKIRRKVASVGGRVRSKTVAPSRLTRDERRLQELLVYPADVERPASREACEGMPRPCPFVSCAHHLFLDVNPQTGAIKLNFPHLEVWEMAETCSLDVADRGGITLEEVGAILNLTRERIRQVEVRGLEKIKDHSGGELGLPPDRARGNDPI